MSIPRRSASGTFRAIFDESGEVYSIRWIAPNDRGRLLRFMVGNGEYAYTLVPENRKNIPALLQLIRDTRLVDPPEAAIRLREIERGL